MNKIVKNVVSPRQSNNNGTAVELAPRRDWTQMRAPEHFVQLYETETFLLGSLRDFIVAGIKAEEACLVVATKEHRDALDLLLRDAGLDMTVVYASGQYVALDAAETLSRFMVDDSVRPKLFRQAIGEVLRPLETEYSRVRIFGEMVALLWAAGNQEGAVGLEECWNDLQRTHPFLLCCAYPINLFNGESAAQPLDQICTKHSHVIPAESYTAIAEADDRLRAITLLQQKALSLEAEIAERKVAQERLQAMFNQAAVGITVVDLAGRLLEVNDRLCQIVSRNRAQLLTMSCADLTHPDDWHCNKRLIAEIAAGQRGEFVVEKRYSRADGSWIWVHVTVSPLLDEQGQPVRMLAIVQDIEARKQAEEKLRENDRRKDEFLAMLAHELRNPLAPVRNAVGVLRRFGSVNPQAERMQDVIERQVEHLTKLVDNLLDVSRVTTGKIALQREPVDLMTLISRAIEMSRPLLNARRQQLSVSVPPWNVKLEADKLRLVQVLANLLNNAAKYTHEGGYIQLIAESKGDNLLLRVIDDGAGIAAHELSYVFDLFAQADRSLDRAQGGLGIGLTLVRKIVELHGGEVAAYSDGPGRGSEIVVRLPLLLERPPQIGETAEGRDANSLDAQVSAGCRILVVDDNVDSAESLVILLQFEGHEVQAAYDGPAAIEAVQAFRPQVVLLDIGLPGMDGFAVARYLRAMPEAQETILIALTGYGEAEDRRQSKDAGFDHHFTKPVEHDLLNSLIKSLILG